MAETEAEQGYVVVGVDGSPASRRALEFAARYALARDVALRVIGVDDTFPDAWLLAYGSTAEYQERRLAFATTVHEAVSESLGKDAQDPHVRIEILPGVPATVLLKESAGAELLVVGTRGHGRFNGLALGSVSHRCALHASCPVAQVPPPDEIALADREDQRDAPAGS